MSSERPYWSVLLLGGQSGVGKTTAAKAIGVQYGIPWLQVDDLRLALQRSRVTLPHNTEALYFFAETTEVWQLPPERVCDSLVAVGEVMAPAIEVVIENHVDTHAPLVIEGDGLLPSLLARPSVRARVLTGRVRAVFLVEPEEHQLFLNLMTRGRGIAASTATEVMREAHAKWFYGQWLVQEAVRSNIPVLAPRPWATLLERILVASSIGISPQDANP